MPESQSREILHQRGIRTFHRPNDLPPFFIDSPEWNEVIEMAKEVLKTFNYRF